MGDADDEYREDLVDQLTHFPEDQDQEEEEESELENPDQLHEIADEEIGDSLDRYDSSEEDDMLADSGGIAEAESNESDDQVEAESAPAIEIEDKTVPMRRIPPHTLLAARATGGLTFGDNRVVNETAQDFEDKDSLDDDLDSDRAESGGADRWDRDLQTLRPAADVASGVAEAADEDETAGDGRAISGDDPGPDEREDTHSAEKDRAGSDRVEESPRPSTVDEYLESLDDEVRTLASKLRGLVVEAAPDAREYLKWGIPHYEESGDLLYLDAKTDHVTVGFFRGAQIENLDVASDLLEGSGRNFRHVRIFTEGDIHTNALQELIAGALQINRQGESSSGHLDI